MKPLSPSLITLLSSGEFNVQNLYEFTLVDGTVLRYTDADGDVTYLTYSWSAGGQTGPYFGGQNSGAGSWKMGLQVDDMVIDITPGSAQVRSVDFLAAITYGFFDGATMKRYLGYSPIGSNVITGALLMFYGRVGDINGGREKATFTIKSITELLNMPLPRELFQASCNNILYGAGCTVNRATFSASGTVETGTTAGVIRATISKPNGYFDLGSIKLTSGLGSGLQRSVKSWVTSTPGTMTLASPFPFAPAVGDTFTAYAGCDLTIATCNDKFSNKVNFRGHPFIPTPETAV